MAVPIKREHFASSTPTQFKDASTSQVILLTRASDGKNTEIKAGGKVTVKIGELGRYVGVTIPANQLTRITLTLNINDLDAVNTFIDKLMIFANRMQMISSDGIERSAKFTALVGTFQYGVTLKTSNAFSFPIPEPIRDFISQIASPLADRCKKDNTLLPTILNSEISLENVAGQTFLPRITVPNYIVDEFSSHMRKLHKPPSSVMSEMRNLFVSLRVIECSRLEPYEMMMHGYKNARRKISRNESCYSGADGSIVCERARDTYHSRISQVVPDDLPKWAAPERTENVTKERIPTTSVVSVTKGGVPIDGNEWQGNLAKGNEYTLYMGGKNASPTNMRSPKP